MNEYQIKTVIRVFDKDGNIRMKHEHTEYLACFSNRALFDISGEKLAECKLDQVNVDGFTRKVTADYTVTKIF